MIEDDACIMCGFPAVGPAENGDLMCADCAERHEAHQRDHDTDTPAGAPGYVVRVGG